MLKDGEKGAILQRDKETYAIAPHLPCGVVSSDELRKIADVADKYNIAALKVTGAQRIAMVGVKEDEIDQIWEDLGTEKGAAIGLCIRSVKACPGTTFCKKGLQDSLGMGLELDKIYHGMELPGKIKMAVSGCIHQCSENCIKDISLVGKKKGWDLMVGGNGGAKPRLAETILKDLTDEEAKYYIDRAVKFMKENSKKNERLSKVLDREGMDAFMEFLLEFREVDDDKITIEWGEDDNAA